MSNLRILIAPMDALAPMRGPMTRARAVAVQARERGHQAAFCASLDRNYRPVDGVPNYEAPMPSPFGAPLFLDRLIFPLVRALGIQRKRQVRSFEEVLHIVGAIHKRFFPKDVAALREAIRGFRPDVVYAEFRPAAIVAARLEEVPAVTGFSYPVQKSYASNPEFSCGVKAFLKGHGLPEVESVLDLFDWAELKFVASSPDLEPLAGEDIVHIGPLIKSRAPSRKSGRRDKIVAYAGTGSITPKRFIRVLMDAFESSDHEVYISTAEVRPFLRSNVQVAKRFDFGELLPEALAFIHHGGQNSIMTGLIYGVPQIICPGNVFERQYNAASMAKLTAGVSLSEEEFAAGKLRALVEEFEADRAYRENARVAGERLLSLGGAARVVETLEEKYGT